MCFGRDSLLGYCSCGHGEFCAKFICLLTSDAFQKKHGQITLDQLRAVDKLRLVKRLGKIDEKTSRVVSELLVEFFKY